MSLDMYVRPGSDTQSVIRARWGEIDEMTRAIGCDTDVARAELTKMSTKQWQRAREGRGVGATFIAKTLIALKEYERTLRRRRLRPTFDNLFEVVVLPRGGQQ